MATITTRVQGDGAKGSPLTNVEVDNNFINLNTAKYESGDSASLSGLTVSDIGTFTTSDAGSTSSALEINNNNAATNNSKAALYIGAGATSSTHRGMRIESGRGSSAFGVTDFFMIDSADGTDAKVMSLYDGGDISFYEDTGTTAKFFWDASAERLGIGTSSPARQLQVGTGGTAASNVHSLMRIEGATRGGGLNGATLEFVHITNAPATLVSSIGTITEGGRSETAMQFKLNSAERMRIDHDGNVGIGTDNPTRQLDVSNAGPAYIRAADTTNSVNVDILAGSAGGWIGTQSNHALLLQTANYERMRITSSGSVGIGSTSPSDFGNDAKLTVQRNGTGESASINILAASNAASVIRFADGTGTAAERNAGVITVNHGSGFMSFALQDAEKMRIDSSGNLSMTGDGSIGWDNWTIVKSGDDLLFKTGSSTMMKLDSSGNLQVAGNVEANASL